jgi:hypothetical protein
MIKRYLFGDLGVNGRKILTPVLKIWNIMMRGTFSCFKIGPKGQDLVTMVMKLWVD